MWCQSFPFYIEKGYRINKQDYSFIFNAPIDLWWDVFLSKTQNPGNDNQRAKKKGIKVGGTDKSGFFPV